MKPLKVALVTRPGSVAGERNAGWWAYPVPEFEWHQFEVPKGRTLSRVKFLEYDLIVWEDGKSLINWIDDGPPIAYLVTDSTLSEEHYRQRCAQARQADIILVDWDRLARFEHLGKPVRRFGYCVNDQRFYDCGLERRVDVGFYATIAGDPDREVLDAWLRDFCEARGYTYESGRRLGIDYARAFAQTKIAVNLNRNPETRNHRLFDAMAAGCCVLTNRVPEVSGEICQAGTHYADIGCDDDWHIGSLLAGEWADIAAAGAVYVQSCHTWALRARQLREIVEEVVACSV